MNLKIDKIPVGFDKKKSENVGKKISKSQEKVDGRSKIEIDYDQKLSFKEVDKKLFIKKFLDLKEKDPLIDEITSSEGLSADIEKRKLKFEDLDIEDKNFIEKATVEFFLKNSGDGLKGLSLMGQDFNREFPRIMEEKYKCNLENMRLGIEMMHHSQVSMEVFAILSNLERENHIVDHVDREILREINLKIEKIKSISQKMAEYRVEATHATNKDSVESINADKLLLRSNSDEKDQYEGDGVYVGMGDYKNWGEKLYKMKINLAGGLPVVNGFHNPSAMVNVLCEMFDIKPAENQLAVPCGLIQWRYFEYRDERFQEWFLKSKNSDQLSVKDSYIAYEDEKLTDWKLKILEEKLGCPAEVIYDNDGGKCVVMDTNEPPIVWASLARALEIRRFVPKSELSKMNLDYVIGYDERQQEIKEGEKIEKKHKDKVRKKMKKAEKERVYNEQVNKIMKASKKGIDNRKLIEDL